MPGRLKKHIGRVAMATLASCVALGVLSADPAGARSLFEMLFGGFARRAPPPDPLPPPASPREQLRSVPMEPGAERPPPRGRSTGYCVRLCDGFYFPVSTETSSACASYCPATQTKLFFGGTIEGATAQDGTRYANLRTAFAYRDQLDRKCTCNGKTPGGLVSIDPNDDPTLRPGDMIATEKGLVAFTGRSRAETAQFRPVEAHRSDPRQRETTGAAPDEFSAPVDRRRSRRWRELR
jgi:hypothetical protein